MKKQVQHQDMFYFHGMRPISLELKVHWFSPHAHHFIAAVNQGRQQNDQ